MYQIDEIKEILTAVENINGEFYDQCKCSPLAFESDGFSSSISFVEKVIWCSEDDEREGFDDDNPEPMEGYLRKEIIRLFTSLQIVVGNFVLSEV